MNERKSLSKRWPLLVAGALAVGLAGLQWVRPRIENPPVTGDIAAPPELAAVLRRSCYDCHSNETHLAWFDHISLASWIVNRDVRNARAALNFSNWDRLSESQRSGKLFEALNQASFGVMPLPDYAALHPQAKLSEQDIATLRNYLIALTPALAEGAAHTTPVVDMSKSAAATPRSEPAAHSSPVRDVRASPNGIPFFADYKNWEAISSTDRVDLGQTRVILGNDIAVKAIADKHTNPWPDGTAFAKLAWAQVTDADGTVRTGEFKTAAFMLKDAMKFAATDGWGFARWHGEGLKPYGDDASFATECVNCHKPMERYDFVFTAPFNLARN